MWGSLPDCLFTLISSYVLICICQGHTQPHSPVCVCVCVYMLTCRCAVIMLRTTYIILCVHLGLCVLVCLCMGSYLCLYACLCRIMHAHRCELSCLCMYTECARAFTSIPMCVDMLVHMCAADCAQMHVCVLYLWTHI